ncbi:MAG: thymidine phosphorylase [Planctomycetota bacterium]
MNVAELILKKRHGKELAQAEIEFLIHGYSHGTIPDYQMAAFAMAVCFQGMSLKETVHFTQSMVDSGEVMNWAGKSSVGDKHSTGGIGDKVSIPLAPMLACCGMTIPMISGRGLGTTGGTLDKLDSIPGYRSEMSCDEFQSIVHWNGCGIAGASSNLAPADKKLYALRDVTGTVSSIPLITSSILSKKAAEGIDALVLDVKWGTGAFMKSLSDAKQLAESLVTVGNRIGLKTTAIISDMNQPLGRMIGNAVEINESVDILQGNGPDDILELTLVLGSQLLLDVGLVSSLQDGRNQLQSKIDTGEAYQKFAEMVASHGGDLDAKREIGPSHAVLAAESGYVSRLNAERLGMAIIEMGGGRRKITDSIDYSSGIEFLVKIGDRVEIGQPIANLFCNGQQIELARELVGASIGIGSHRVEQVKLIVETVARSPG